MMAMAEVELLIEGWRLESWNVMSKAGDSAAMYQILEIVGVEVLVVRSEWRR